ncbi:MAG: hypothetical protein ACXABI_07485 [Candidatus Hodarchaeales archaeon]
MMNLIDILQPIFELFFPFFVMLLVFLSWRSIRSFWSQEFDLSQPIKLKKGTTVFKDPIRPHSKSFYTYLQLAFMTTPNRQKRLVQMLSERLKDSLEYHPQYSNKKMSKDLELLINDPNQWLQTQYSKISISRFSRNKIGSDILHKRIIELLVEVKDIYDLQILPNLE